MGHLLDGPPRSYGPGQLPIVKSTPCDLLQHRTLLLPLLLRRHIVNMLLLCLLTHELRQLYQVVHSAS